MSYRVQTHCQLTRSILTRLSTSSARCVAYKVSTSQDRILTVTVSEANCFFFPWSLSSRILATAWQAYMKFLQSTHFPKQSINVIVKQCIIACAGVMPHCLEPGSVKKVIEKSFDGLNWETSYEKEQAKIG